MEHVEIMVQGAIVERDDLHKVLDEDKLRREMGHRYQAEVLILKGFLKINRHLESIRRALSLKKSVLKKHCEE